MARASIFTIEVDGKPRKLFAIQQRASGDLTIIIKHGVHATEDGTYHVPNTVGAKIKERRISIHRSIKSPTNINAIKITTVRADGRVAIFRHYTKATRRRHAFAPLYLERCSDLSDTRYIVEGEIDSRLSLGAYDPKHFQLIYKVFVGSGLSEFRAYGKYDINLIQVALGDFRIVIMWCFASGPSTPSRHTFSFQTLAPDQLRLIPGLETRLAIESIADGYDENGCIHIFSDLRQEAMRIFFQNMANDTPTSEQMDMSHIESSVAFFRYPDITTREFVDHFRRFELSLILQKTSK
jgi:hypothetical protein